MWGSICQSITGCGSKKKGTEAVQDCHDSSDDESSSNVSTDEGLECPICWESFNMVENVPYVLWCGHTLCKNCVLGLRLAVLDFYNRKIQIPIFVSCPWCKLLSVRWVYKGIVKFPRKNFFLLWMVECRNGDRVKSLSSVNRDHQQVWSPRCSSIVGNYSSTSNHRRIHRLGRMSSRNNHGENNGSISFEGPQSLFHKSLDFFNRMSTKFPLVILLLIIIFALPTSVVILMLYLVITTFFALPAFLVLYFAYPALNWLCREIRT